jgi:hypothetical protein
MMITKSLISFCMVLALASLVAPARAEDSRAAILSPADGAKLPAKQNFDLQYEVHEGAKADHVHLYIDGDEAAVIHKLKGSYTIDGLDPGKHGICLRVVNKSHVPVGTESCIHVTVE